jgi:hypothetical protein
MTAPNGSETELIIPQRKASIPVFMLASLFAIAAKEISLV